MGYKSKTELGISDNKTINIEKIDGIEIENFRMISNQNLELGNNITVVSGRNGTMKSTLMGLVVHPFETQSKNIFNHRMVTKFSDVFKLSLVKDDSSYLYHIKMSIDNNGRHLLKEPVKLYKQGDRFRLVPSGSEKGDGFFSLPSIYINLKRLFPLVELENSDIREVSIEFTDGERKSIANFYERIFGKTEFSGFNSYQVKSGAVNKNPFAPNEDADYDINSISAGEDNLSAFIQVLISFERLRKINPNSNLLTGILAIDEFEASLHPIAQANLYDYLLEWSRKNKVQIILNTHSLYLIKYILSNKELLDNGSVVMNFITSRFSDELEIYKNQDFKFVKEELTLSQEKADVSITKIKVICEDDVAINYLKQILGTKLASRCMFISNITGDIGNSWKTLKAILKNGSILLRDAKAMVVFDGDITEKEIGVVKGFNNILYLPTITSKKIPLEKELVNYILSLNASDNFFKTVNKTKAMFDNEFGKYNIRLSPIDIEKEKIDPYKNWYEKTPKIEVNKYRRYMIRSNQSIFDDFKKCFKEKLNEILEENGLPKIE